MVPFGLVLVDPVPVVFVQLSGRPNESLEVSRASFRKICELPAEPVGEALVQGIAESVVVPGRQEGRDPIEFGLVVGKALRFLHPEGSELLLGASLAVGLGVLAFELLDEGGIVGHVVRDRLVEELVLEPLSGGSSEEGADEGDLGVMRREFVGFGVEADATLSDEGVQLRPISAVEGMHEYADTDMSGDLLRSTVRDALFQEPGAHHLSRLQNRLKRVLLLIVASLLVWLVVAYLLLPFAFRHYEHQQAIGALPMVTQTADGMAGDPFNIGLVGTQRQVVGVMRILARYRPLPSRFATPLLFTPDPRQSVGPLPVRSIRMCIAPPDSET